MIDRTYLTLPCLCVSGESGLGKSTLINSLFLTDLYSPEYPGPSHRIKKTVQVTEPHSEFNSKLHEPIRTVANGHSNIANGVNHLVVRSCNHVEQYSHKETVKTNKKKAKISRTIVQFSHTATTSFYRTRDQLFGPNRVC